MLVEQIIFTFISFAIFVLMFFRMIKNNDTTYVAVLVVEVFGIALNFLEVLFDIKLNMLFLILKYILAILIPIFIIILEKKGIMLLEIWNLQKAKMSIFLGNDKEAKQALLKVLDRNQNSYKAHLMLAQVYENEGGMRKAIDEYVQAIDSNKKDDEAYYKVAKLLNGLDKKEEASQMLFNLLNKKPEITKASMLLGEILIDAKMYKEAVNVYQEALRFDQVNYDLYYNLGIAYTMLNDFQNAKTCYEKAAELNSLLYNAKYSLAEIALIYKDLEEAEKRFLEVIEDEELSADAYYELSKIYLIKGDKEIAIKYINTAIDANSKKIVEKVKKDPIFIPIMAKISIPFNLEEPEIEDEKKKLKEKEREAKEHLEEMSELTRNLSYNDIKLLKKNGEEKKETSKEEKENGRERAE